MSFWKSPDVPPPGDDNTNRARPEMVKLAARVTMMSGTPDTVMMLPTTVESATAIASTAMAMARHAPRPRPSIHSADRQLVNTNMAPTDRSIPPEITTTAWAMARNARLMAPAVMVRISNAPNSSTCDRRQSTRNTSSTATPAAHPCRRAKRDARLVGSGRVVTDGGQVERRCRPSCRPCEAVGRARATSSRRRPRATRPRMAPLCSTAARSHTMPISRSSLVNIRIAVPSSARSRIRS